MKRRKNDLKQYADNSSCDSLVLDATECLMIMMMRNVVNRHPRRTLGAWKIDKKWSDEREMI